MKKSAWLALLLGFAALPASAQAPAPSQAPAQAPAPAPVELKAGDQAPEFSLQGSDGKVHTLAEHKGKNAVVIAWFPKAFTGG